MNRRIRLGKMSGAHAVGDQPNRPRVSKLNEIRARAPKSGVSHQQDAGAGFQLKIGRQLVIDRANGPQPIGGSWFTFG
jgi:hypothetical protein